MTRKQAQNLMDDLGKNLEPTDYNQNIYISVKDVGTRVYKQCAHYETEGYTFIWTQEESFLMDQKEMGDLVIIPYEHTTHASFKKAI